jgi:putative ABC transport system permease protein
MVVRGLIRQPFRLMLSSVGIAMATAIIVAGDASIEAVTHLFDVQFDQSQREDIEVTYPEPLSSRVRRELESLEGVHRVELQRMAPIRIRFGPRSRETVLRAVSEKNELRQLLNREETKERIPSGGIVLSRALAELLGTGVGDTVEVEHLAGDRARRTIRVAALLNDSLGLSAYMESDALARFLGEQELADGALLAVDSAQLDEVKRRLVALPAVVGLTRPAIAKELFRRQMADVLIAYILVLALSAAAIAVGVVYNNARIALATRSRDLATLRILGFRRAEVARVLIGEQVVQVALGIPAGLALGGFLAQAFYASMDPELYRLAVSVSGHTRSLAATVVLLATALSAVSIIRGVRNMDLVSVLKARD